MNSPVDWIVYCWYLAAYSLSQYINFPNSLILLLVLGVAAALAKSRDWALLIALSTGSFGLIFNAIELKAIASLFALHLALRGQRALPQTAWYQWAISLGVTLAGFLFYLHFIPGFHNWRWLDVPPLSPDSLPLVSYINLDKVLAGTIVLAYLSPTALNWRLSFRQWRQWAVIALVTITSTMVGSFALGYVRLDLKWFDFMPLLLAQNLLFTVIPEEGLFRGYLLEEFERLWPKWLWPAHGPIFACALIYGAPLHTASTKFALLATLAGVGYGYARISRSLVGSIALHFAVNAIHMVAFSYPALR